MTFFPWIISGLIAAFFPSYGYLSALTFALLSFSQLRKGFILEWSSLIFFGVNYFNDQFLKTPWITEHISILSSLFFALVAFISLLVRQPFTLQYAKHEVEEKFWDSPLFMRVNTILTAGLGIIFLCVTLVNLYRHFHPGLLNGWMVWGAAFAMKLLFIKTFPPWYKKRILQKKIEANL